VLPTTTMNTGGNSLPSQLCPDSAKRRVCYYYDRLIAGVDYGEDHVMVPRRVDTAHALIRSYGLLGDMARLRTRPATDAEISAFHDGRYVGLLRDLTRRPSAPAARSRAGPGAATSARSLRTAAPSTTPVAGLWQALRRRVAGRRARARQRASRRRRQLVRRHAPRMSGHGQRLLLCQ